MGLFSRKSWFDYIEDLPQSMLKQTITKIEKTAEDFGIRDFTSGEYLAARIYEIVEEVLKTNTLPDGYEEIQTLAEGLGLLYAHAICVGRKWKWKRVGDDGRSSTVCIVSPKGNFSLEPVKYVVNILSSETASPDNNSILSLYQRADKIDKKPKPKKYYPII